MESVAKGFPVMETTFHGEILRLHVAEFAAPAKPYLWRLRKEPAFLIKSLCERLAKLPNAGFANRLARGDIGGVPASVEPPSWLQNGQEDAYRACLGEGLWLVWGPPGTGKTRVLRATIGELLADKRRVLLVSGTNVAVDNALHEVLKERHYQPGEIVRVGPPELREIAGNPDVCLPLMVRAKLAQVEEQRREAAQDLREMDDREQRLGSLNTQLAGFDPAGYEQAVTLLATPGRSLAELDTALAQCEEEARNFVQTFTAIRAAREAALAEVAKADSVRPLWAGVHRMEAELADLDRDVRQAETRALRAKIALDTAEDEVIALQRPDGTVRWRDRHAHRDAQDRLDDNLQKYEEARASAVEARRIAKATRGDTESEIARLAASARLSWDEVQRRDSAAARTGERVHALEQVWQALADRRRRLDAARTAAREAEELIATCRQRGWPDLYAKARELRGATTRDSARRRAVQERHDELQGQYERMAKDAQGEIVKNARLVATTLARFRIVKAVFDGPYDVVLIDEVGAATLPEVLLAVAKAGRCAVLLGDFMQLGPVLPPALERTDRSDIRKWLITDPFRHCGISTLAEARNHRSCLVLDTQHRFGPDVMRFADLLAYDGLLTAGPAVRAHTEGDPEIVLIDTDGLGDLARVQWTSAVAGWWPAGLLLSRTLVEMHRENGEATGVVTPYRVQADATLEALRDVEPDGKPLADVGTAHRFQGREFPIVVFDTVESEFGDPGWIAKARLIGGDDWLRSGVRLCNVATTRVKHRLYVIASGQRVQASKGGTALGHLDTLWRDNRVIRVRATTLVTPPAWDPVPLGPESTALREVLARHIEVTDISDEDSFYDQLALLISQAKHSIWLWSAWVATRVYRLLPLLQAARDRGVTITVFTRDPSNKFQGSENSAKAVNALRGVVSPLVEEEVAHQKVIVIDGQTVMIGSLNVLSQRRSHEVMITMRGEHFARKLLSDHLAVMAASMPDTAPGATRRSRSGVIRQENTSRSPSGYWAVRTRTRVRVFRA